jgi:hypothetical protein
MSVLWKWVRRAAFVFWLAGLALLLFCWRCDDWLPKNGIHAGDERLATGGLLGGEDMPKEREILLAGGSAERAGYVLRFVGGSRAHLERDLTEVVRTTKWKRTDRNYSFDDDGYWEPNPVPLVNWGWIPAGFGINGWHYFMADHQDEKEQLTVQISTSKLLLGYVVASATCWAIRIGLWLARFKRRGFPVNVPKASDAPRNLG